MNIHTAVHVCISGKWNYTCTKTRRPNLSFLNIIVVNLYSSNHMMWNFHSYNFTHLK